MRWAVSKCDWRKRFAWLPVKIGDEWIWLERYESMFCGDYSLVRLPGDVEASPEGADRHD